MGKEGKKCCSLSSLLFEGFAKIVDIGAIYRGYYPLGMGYRLDRRALHSDWEKVGGYIEKAVEEFSQEEKTKREKGQEIEANPNNFSQE